MEEASLNTIRKNLVALKEKAGALSRNSNTTGIVSTTPQHSTRKIENEEMPTIINPRPASLLPLPTPPPSPHLTQPSSSEPSNISSIINRAENLLNRVKNSRAYADAKPVETLHDDSRKLLSYNDTHLASNNLLVTRRDFNPNIEYFDSDLTEVDLLLKGIPEGFDDEPNIDDEMVETLLKVGGPPPSQLELPSLYASNQRTMERLNKVCEIKISLLHFLVYSSKYGVRKEGSYFVIRGPRSYPIEDDMSQPIVIPLPELKKKDLILLSDKKDNMKNYFVGDVDIDKVVSFPINIDDRLVNDWINGKNGIEIELYSYLSPPGSKPRGSGNNPVLFAKAVVFMGGILGTKDLDAFVNSDFEVDVSNHTIVMSRMRALALGQNVKPVGSKLGIVSLRVSLLSEEARTLPYNNNFVEPPTVLQPFHDQPSDELTLEKVHSIPTFPVDQALHYKPSEVKYPPTTYVDDTDSKIEVKSFIKKQKSKKYFALALYNISQLQFPSAILADIENRDVTLRLVYKFSLSVSDSLEVMVPMRADIKTKGFKVNVALGKVNICDDSYLKFPIIELWVEYTKENMLHRKILGRSKSTYTCQDGDDFKLPLFDIATLKEVLVLNLVYLRGGDGWKLEEDIQHKLDLYAAHCDDLDEVEPATNPQPTISLRDSIESNLSVDSLSNDNILADITLIKEKLEDFPHDHHLIPASARISIRSSHESLQEDSLIDVVQLLNDKPHQTTSIIQQPPSSSSRYQTESRVHVLDFSLHGNYAVQSNSPFDDVPIMGCHVCYALQNLSKEDANATNARKLIISEGNLTESVSMFSLWWDSECAILNSTNRHRFECALDPGSISAALGINPNVGLLLYLVDCDGNGNLPKDITPFGKVVLTMEMVASILSDNITEKLIKLPVQYLKVDHDKLLESNIVLKCSHRWEPVLLKKSNEGILHHHEEVSKGEEEVKQSNEMPSKALSLYGDVIFPKQETNQHHDFDFLIHVNQFSHLILPHDNQLLQGKLFFSLSIVKNMKPDKFNQQVVFSTLFPWKQQIDISMDYSLNCPSSNKIAATEDTDLLYDDAMRDVAKSSLVVNLYERLDLFPKETNAQDNKEPMDGTSTMGYPPLHVRATDKFMGTAVIDLSVLAIGMPYIEGWYNLLNDLHHIIGQLKVKVCLRESKLSGLSNLKPLDTTFGEVRPIVNVEEDHEADSIEEKKEEEEDNMVTDMNYDVDDSLIDIKAMEYAALKKLLDDLEQTKERLLNGWSEQPSNSFPTELNDGNVSSGESYDTEFASITISSKTSSPSKAGSVSTPHPDQSDDSMYSSNFSNVSSVQYEDKRIDLIMQEFDKAARYNLNVVEQEYDDEQQSYSSDFESYTSANVKDDQLTFNEIAPNFTANLESPIRFPGGNIDWKVEVGEEEDGQESHVESDRNDVTKDDHESFSTYSSKLKQEEERNDEKQDESTVDSTMLPSEEDKLDDSNISGASSGSAGERSQRSYGSSHYADSNVVKMAEGKFDDDSLYSPVPTPEWKRVVDVKDDKSYYEEEKFNYPEMSEYEEKTEQSREIESKSLHNNDDHSESESLRDLQEAMEYWDEYDAILQELNKLESVPVVSPLRSENVSNVELVNDVHIIPNLDESNHSNAHSVDASVEHGNREESDAIDETIVNDEETQDSGINVSRTVENSPSSYTNEQNIDQTQDEFPEHLQMESDHLSLRSVASDENSQNESHVEELNSSQAQDVSSETANSLKSSSLHSSPHNLSADKINLAREENTEKKQDSPMTSKIRVLVNEEVDRLLDSKLASRHAVYEDKQIVDRDKSKQLSSNTSFPTRSSGVVDKVDFKSIPLTFKEEEEVEFCDTLTHPTESKSSKKSDAEILQEHLRQMQETLMANKKPNRQYIRYPGRHRSFIDAETERVSKIMLGTLGGLSTK